ncbi:MAG TPA: tetratricopeptide repeat protein, partial [Bacteroidota bacterium]
KTFQLVRNIVKSLGQLLLNRNQRPSGTLMARMAHDQYIGLKSEVYERGITQFEGNMRDILEMAAKHSVPVILGTLACNLRDQFPFVSMNSAGYPRADSVFKEARMRLQHNKWMEADSLFRFAKDLDALRFRAPTQINNEIMKLGNEFGCPVVNVDSAFDAASPSHVVGDDLMTDHLHPTLRGYHLIGSLFYGTMKQFGRLPSTKALPLSDPQQDSVTIAAFPFAALDSVIGRYRIQLLKNDWPYISKANKIPDEKLLQPRNRIDSIAYELVEDRTNWDIAQRKAAEWFASRNDMDSFARTMNVLINQYPIVMDYYDYASTVLLEKKDYNRALSFLTRRNDFEPCAYSTKWLGTLSLFRNQLEAGEKYLKESLTFNNKDPQVWYNLAGVYVQSREYQRALQTVDQALALNPRYPDALALRERLKQATKQ